MTPPTKGATVLATISPDLRPDSQPDAENPDQGGDLLDIRGLYGKAMDEFHRTFPSLNLHAIAILRTTLEDVYTLEEEEDIIHECWGQFLEQLKQNPKQGISMGGNFLEIVKAHVECLRFQAKFDSWLSRNLKDGVPIEQLRALFEIQVLPSAPAGFEYADLFQQANGHAETTDQPLLDKGANNDTY
jgi:hypothetical protein